MLKNQHVTIGLTDQETAQFALIRSYAFPTIFKPVFGVDGWRLILKSDKALQLGIKRPGLRWKKLSYARKTRFTKRREAIAFGHELTFTIWSQSRINPRTHPGLHVTVPR